MVRQVIHHIPLNYLLHSPSGAVARDLLKRGYKVQARAKVLISGAGPGHPKRVRTGNTRSSINVRLLAAPSLRVRVGTNVWYAIYIHGGTGIYGPRKTPIRPKRAKALRFRINGQVIFAKSVKGMRKNQFLKDALPAMKD